MITDTRTYTEVVDEWNIVPRKRVINHWSAKALELNEPKSIIICLVGLTSKTVHIMYHADSICVVSTHILSI